MTLFAVSNKIPSVFVADVSSAQVNARASWLARSYGVSVKVVEGYEMVCICGTRVLAVNGSWADEGGIYCSESCLNNWQAKDWYCQHSYEFCTPCFAGYDHPNDEAADREAYDDSAYIDPMYCHDGDNRQ